MAYGYRPLNLQTANPALAALEGYKGVDSIIKDNEDRKIAALDRERRIGQENREEKRAQTLYERQMQQYLDQDTLKGLQSFSYGLNQIRDNVEMPEEAKVEQLYQLYQNQPEQVRQLFDADLPSLKDTAKVKAATNQFHEGMRLIADGNGGKGKQQVIDSLNIIYDQQLNAGEARGGASPKEKRVKDLRLNDDGQVAVLLEIDTDGGESYEEWMTVGRSSDPEDPVKLVDPGFAAQSVDTMGLMASLADRINAERVGRGDAVPLTKQTEKRGARAKGGALGEINDMVAGLDSKGGYEAMTAKALELSGPLIESGEVTTDDVKKALDMRLNSRAKDISELMEGKKLDVERLKAYMSGETGGLKPKDIVADIEALTKQRASILARQDIPAQALATEDFDKAIADLDAALANAHAGLKQIAPDTHKARYSDMYPTEGGATGKALDPSDPTHAKLMTAALSEANGDKAKAKEILKQRGWSL